MVGFYKHHIPSWMDGTEKLSDGAYRSYHVVCQLIYLHEGPIALNERGIAGRCNQSVKSFQKNLAELVSRGKLTVENGRISNKKAEQELANVRKNRRNAALGGKSSANATVNSEIDASNPLNINDTHQASLERDESLKEKRREEKSIAEQSAAPGEVDRDDPGLRLRLELVRLISAAGRQLPPDCGRAYTWIALNFRPEICTAVVREAIDRGKQFGSLSYFDERIAEAHRKLAPAVLAPAQPRSDELWRKAVERWQSTTVWLFGKDSDEPDRPTTKVPKHILAEFGLAQEAA